MTDHPENLAPYRMPRTRDSLKQISALTPFLRYVPKNPLFLIGAAAVGLAGVMAWRNREKIAATTGPMLDEAKAKSASLIEDAKTKGEDLIDQAKATGEAVVAKTRRRAAPKATVPDLH